MITKERTLLLVSDFLVWVLRKQNCRGVYPGLWGGSELTGNEYDWTLHGSEEQDIWTTTQKVIEVLVSFNFSLNSVLLAYPIQWLSRNYDKMPRKKSFPILGVLLDLKQRDPDSAEIEAFYQKVIADIHTYIRNSSDALKAYNVVDEKNSEKFLKSIEHEAPYHILSNMLRARNTIGLSEEEIAVLLGLFIKATRSFLRNTLSTRVSYALLCLTLLYSSTLYDKYKDLLSSLGINTDTFIRECLQYINSHISMPNGNFCWNEQSSVTNIYNIYALNIYSRCEYIQRNPDLQRILEELQRKAILGGGDTAIEFIINQKSNFVASGNGHLKSDPPASGEYSTFNKVYTTAVCISMLKDLYPSSESEVLSLVLSKPGTLTGVVKESPFIGEKEPIILHLSDIQFGDEVQIQILAHFKRGLLDFMRKHEIQPNILVISGDISSKASEVEFNQVKTHILDIAKSFNISLNRVIFSPGNHDMNWTISKARYLDPVQLRDLKSGKGAENLTKALKANRVFIDGKGEAERVYVVKEDEISGELSQYRFSPYEKFVYDFYHYGEHEILSLNLFNKKKQYTIHEIPEMKLLIVSLNTVQTIDWNNQVYKHTRHETLVENIWAHLEEDIKKYSNTDFLKIMVVHGPLLREKDRFTDELKENSFYVVLSGHEHEEDGFGKAFKDDPGVNVMNLVSGTLSGTTPPLIGNSFKLIPFTRKDLSFAAYPIDLYLDFDSRRRGQELIIDEVRIKETEKTGKLIENWKNRGATVYKGTIVTR